LTGLAGAFALTAGLAAGFAFGASLAGAFALTAGLAAGFFGAGFAGFFLILGIY
jgi:hypothetical protein